MSTFKKITDFIESKTDAIVGLERLLTSIPAMAPESDGDGELKKCEALEKYLKEAGFSNFERLDAPDERVSSKIRPNLIVTIPGKNDKERLWIMSHLDVVPPGDLSKWESDPWTVIEKDGKLIGRGVEDNQQGLVSSVFAALAFIKLGITPEHTIKLLFVADEEVGSQYGIIYLLNKHNLFTNDDLILVPDGGDPKGETIEIAEKTGLWLKVITKGVQTHASMPNTGKNAFVAACGLALRLNDLENHFNKKDDLFSPNYSTFQPTKKEANVPNVNTIPGDDVFYVDCRILPSYDVNEVLKEMQKRASEVEKKYGVDIKFEYDEPEVSPATPKDAKIVSLLSSAVKKVKGIETSTIGIGGGTVAACLRAKGFNAVVWSSLDDSCHQPNEYAFIKNIVSDAKVMAAMMFGVENI